MQLKVSDSAELLLAVAGGCTTRAASRTLTLAFRQCHDIDGRPYDRLWFDLLIAEHEEIRDGQYESCA